MNTKNRVALLVHSCDRYELLYKGFEFFFNRHWNFSIPCNYYFATEEKQVSVKGFTNILSGKGQWTDRLKNLLESIEEDYVLYFQEDMWLNKDVNPRFFEELFSLAVTNNWMQVKLHSSEVYKAIETETFIEGFNIATIDKLQSGFLMSHQVTLWNKAFLFKQLPSNEHPWRNERKGSKRLKKVADEIYYADYFSENGKPEQLINRSPIGRSEYRTVSINGTFNADVIPFISELQNGSETDREYANKIHHHFVNQLTHDGKPKPRKEDIFKKVKRWINNK